MGPGEQPNWARLRGVRGHHIRCSIAIACGCALPAAAVAAVPSGTTTVPLEQGVLLGFGAVYRVQTTIDVPSLRTRTGTLFPLGHLHTVTELGTAFAVSPNGILVTDAHVAAPQGAQLAFAAAPLALAQHGIFGSSAAYNQWVTTNGVLPVGARVTSITVWRVSADPHHRTPALVATVLPTSVERANDLALLSIRAHNLPALLLEEDETINTPVATVGFGVTTTTTLGLPTTHVPAIKTGTLGGNGTASSLPGQQLTLVNIPISQGDSGGPVLDAQGSTRGIVRFVYSDNRGLVDQSSTIAHLMMRLHIANTQGPTGLAFSAGMHALWAHHYNAAVRALATARQLDPQHPLAATELTLARTLAATPQPGRRAPWWRVSFLALAGIALLVGGWCIRRLRPKAPDHPDLVPPLS